MSIAIKPNFVVLSGKQLHLQSGAQTRTDEGSIGQFECGKVEVKIHAMTGVWSGQYPSDGKICGGEIYKNNMYDVVAPGCEDRSAVMIDDWTYMTRIDFP